MEIENLLPITERAELRRWLEQNHAIERCCWVITSRAKQPIKGTIPYLEVVEEALCFGWIDSTLKRLPDGRLAQRLSPRRKDSHWTELNKQRCADLERRGLMTEAGREAWKKAMTDEGMTPQQFVAKFREAFGPAAPLPIAIWYGDKPVAAGCRVPRCIIGAISNVQKGNPLALTSELVQCGGGGLYTAFRPMPERVPIFVSQVEHYKQTPELVRDYVADLAISITDKPYLNFVRVDHIDDWAQVEAVLFFATPDILSGLCSWAYYDKNAPDTISAPFASGCASVITFATWENRRKGKRCFLGMFDPSARPCVPKNELSFAVPMSRFAEMLVTMPDSALFQPAFLTIRRRINGEIG